MTAELKGGLTREESLGYPSYWRATFEPYGIYRYLDWVPGDHDFVLGMKAVYEAIPATQLVVAVNPNTTLMGDTSAVVDLRGLPEARANTVADLVDALDHLGIRTSLLSLERVSADDVYGDSAAAQREAANQDAVQQAAAHSLTHEIGSAAENVASGVFGAWKTAAIIVMVVLALWFVMKAKGLTEWI